MRITRASDDAAGLAVASKLQVSSRIYSQAIRNANDGLSALNIANGTLTELSSVLTRLKELATQAANGTFSLAQRLALDTEANQLTNEYNRLVGSASFNGRQLLNGTFGSLSLQVGWGENAVLHTTLGEELSRSVGTGSFESPVTVTGAAATLVASADFNRDGLLDFIDVDSTGLHPTMHLNQGDSSFSSTDLSIGILPNAVTVGDVNGDGIEDIVYRDDFFSDYWIKLGIGDGTFRSGTNAMDTSTFNGMQLIDINGDGLDDLVGRSGDSINVALAQANRTFQFVGSFATPAGLQAFTVADFNGDSRPDIAVSATNTIGVLLNTGNGSFAAAQTQSVALTLRTIAAGDINHDGKMDLIGQPNTYVQTFLGTGDGSLTASTSYSTAVNLGSQAQLVDMNGDGELDIVVTGQGIPAGASLLLNNGDGTYGAAKKFFTTMTASLLVGDFSGDSVPDVLVSGAFIPSLLKAVSTETANIQRFNLTTQTEARATLDLLEDEFERIQGEMSTLGAMQSRIESALQVLSQSRENYEAAASRIQDADIAQETADLLRTQIAPQAASAVLGQANLVPMIALRLLQAA